MSYFEFTGETKVWCGITLKQIRATKDLKCGVKKGDVGGWIEKEAQVSGNAWVYGDARVYGNARVYGDARVESAGAILWLTIGAFYTVTLTRKLIFISCKSWTRSEARKLTQKQAMDAGCPEHLFKPLKQMVLWGMRIVKEEP